MKLITTKLLMTALLPVFFAGCGSDDDRAFGTRQQAPEISAEGVYGGTLTGSTAADFEALILENGDFWALYGQDGGSIFTVHGFIQGQGVSNDGSFAAPSVKDFGFAPALSGELTSTYNSTAKTISGTVTYAGGSVQFTGGPIPGSLYNYDAAAALSSISGSWTTLSTSGGSVAVNIAGSGAVTTSEGGCSGSGTIAPRASGKNVFNISLTFGASPCELPGQTATGIAIAYPLSTGQTQLIAAITNESKTLGVAVFGIR